MTVQIKVGRNGTWYEKELGKQFEVEESSNGYGDHLVLNVTDGYNRWINKHDFIIIQDERV